MRPAPLVGETEHMRYARETIWDERPTLGVGRALTVALTYSAAMAGCAALIAMSADQVARMAAPLLQPVPAASASVQAASQLKTPGSSNAAIIAKLEARQHNEAKQAVRKQAAAQSRLTAKVARR